MDEPLKIGFIGAGQMAQALAGGIAAGRLESRFFVSDPSADAIGAFQERVGEGEVNVLAENRDVVAAADLVFIAVKPQYLGAAVGTWVGEIRPAPLLISIVAGADLAGLAERTGSRRLIRVMPNTPSLVNCGATAIAAGEGATDADVTLVQALLEPLGIARLVPESQLDAVTGLSGSGPAYVFLLIEALSDGGVRMGLPRGLAAELAAHTVRGAAELVIRSGEHPAILKDRVASPGGTTIAGLEALERHGFRSAAIAAVRAAAERASELRD